MNDPEHPADGVDRSSGPVRLAPPPRIADRSGEAAITGPRRGGWRQRGPAFWLTAIGFVLLGAVAVGVFAVLPGWVAARSGSPDEPLSLPAAEVEAGISADPTVVPPETRSRVVRETAPERSGTPKPPARAEASAVPPSTTPDTERSGLGRPVAPSRQEAEFAAAMGAGLRALEAGDLTVARSSLERAHELDPGSRAAVDALSRLAAAEQHRSILAHQTRAAELESAEQWDAALGEYEAVLTLDEALRFAQDGRSRTALRAALDRRLEGHLAHLQRLSDDAVLAAARELLEEAQGIPDPGAKLAGQIERLSQAVVVASTPVPVVLLSDGATEVLVYRYGRLGVFLRKELALRPGRYTVVGSRDGFRDVRHQLEVSADAPPAPLTVRCEERI